MKLQIAFTWTSLIFHKDFQMLLAIKEGEIQFSTSCTRSHIATTRKKMTTKTDWVSSQYNGASWLPSFVESSPYAYIKKALISLKSPLINLVMGKAVKLLFLLLFLTSLD